MECCGAGAGVGAAWFPRLPVRVWLKRATPAPQDCLTPWLYTYAIVLISCQGYVPDEAVCGHGR